MENTSVIVETTTPESQPEEQIETEVTPSEEPEGTEPAGETTDEPSEEAPKTDEPVDEPKSKANERIRELIKKTKQLEAENIQLKKNQPEIQGVTEDGEVEVDKLFNSAVEKAKNDLAQATTSKEITEANNALARQAVIDFEYMKESVWQEEAQVLVERGIDPYTAAEMVGQKIKYLRGETEKKIAKQVKADKALKNNSFTPSGTKPNTTDGGFTQEQIAAMSTKEYEKNKSKILKQYGIKADL